MGSDHPNPSQVHEFQPTLWSPCEWLPSALTQQIGLPALPRNMQPNAIYQSQHYSFLIDEYWLPSSETGDRQSFAQMVEWRNKDENLVTVRFVATQPPSICRSKTMNQVLTEHIWLRMTQFTEIPFGQNLYFLKACLEGFRSIWKRVGVVQVRQQLIGVNEQGRVKVWMHSNFAKTTPEIVNCYKTSKFTEAKIVQDIIELADKNTDHTDQPRQFTAYLQEKGITSLKFDEALSALEDFAQQLEFSIPAKLNSALELIFPPMQRSRSSLPSVNGEVGGVNRMNMIQTLKPTHIHSEEQYNMSEDRWLDQSNHGVGLERTIKISPSRLVGSEVSKTPGQEMGFETTAQKESFLERSRARSFPRGIQASGEQPVVQEVACPAQKWQYFNQHQWHEIDSQIAADLTKMHYGM